MRVLDVLESRMLGMTEHKIKQLTQSPIPGKVMYASIYLLTDWKDFGQRNKEKTSKGEKPLGKSDLLLLPLSLKACDKGVVAEGTDHVHDSSIGHVSKSVSLGKLCG